jgi:hypothetical protein
VLQKAVPNRWFARLPMLLVTAMLLATTCGGSATATSSMDRRTSRARPKDRWLEEMTNVYI